MEEGWYLMSTGDLEIELARHRDPGADRPPSHAVRLEVHEALAFRNAGNLPDEGGRSLRLVLRIERAEDLHRLHTKRLEFEPDYHSAPSWRREGSRAVNVVPLRDPGVEGSPEAWWEKPATAELERMWQATGEVEGIRVPGAYRSFVYKTVLSLRDAGLPVTIDAICDSILRWLPDQAEAIRAALNSTNPPNP